jgi:hypothetical protein
VTLGCQMITAFEKTAAVLERLSLVRFPPDTVYAHNTTCKEKKGEASPGILRIAK